MATKTSVKQTIREARKALRLIMQEGLADIAQAMVQQIMANYRKLPESRMLEAINGVQASGVNAYREKLLNALAVIAAEAIEQARREVPKKRNVRLSFDDESLKLGEFENLPPAIRNRISVQLKLLIGTQISDLEKAIYFQYASSAQSTDSEELILKDLTESGAQYIEGMSVAGAASASSSQIVNEARLAFFTDDDVSDEIEAYEFVNEDPNSPICQDLAGTVFAKDDPNLNRYWPPLHFNCDSWIRPILKGNLGKKEISSFQPSKLSLEKHIQFSENACIDLHLVKPGLDV